MGKIPSFVLAKNLVCSRAQGFCRSAFLKDEDLSPCRLTGRDKEVVIIRHLITSMKQVRSRGMDEKGNLKREEGK